MFVVETGVLLPHPPPAVARVVGHLHLLPRWCDGLRRVRYPDAPPAAGCVFAYTAPALRLTLVARTLDPERTDAGTRLTHVAAGDGLTLTWTFDLEPAEADAGRSGGGGPLGAPGPARSPTRLRARTAVAVDPEHPLAAARAALCRVVARRAPAGMERLRTFLDRVEAGRRGSHPRPGAGPPPAPHPEPPDLAPPAPDGALAQSRPTL